MLEQTIGVIYRSESEFMSHYFEAVLAEQFDAQWLVRGNRGGDTAAGRAAAKRA